MTRKFSTAAVMLVMAGGTAGAAEPAAPAKQLEADYVITWLGLPVYSGKFAITWNGERYRMRFRAEAEGVVRLAANTTIDWETSGRLAQGRVLPERFAQANTFRRQTRRITLAYAAQGAPAVSVVPPESPGKRPPVPEPLKAGTLDPLSAIFAAIAVPLDAKSCGYSAKVFEGLRRTDVRLDHRRRAQPGGSGPAGPAPSARPPAARPASTARPSSACCTPSGSPAMRRSIFARTPSLCRRPRSGWRSTRAPGSGCPRNCASSPPTARSMRASRA